MLRHTLIIALFMLGCAGTASAGDEMAPFNPVPDFAPRSIIFDDAHGKSDLWGKDLPCGANRATVTIKFDKAYHSEHWAPVAKVRLMPLKQGAGPDASSSSVAAVVKAPTDAFNLNAMVWVEKVTGQQSDGQGVAPADLSTPMQIDLAWTPDGDVTVNFGGEFQKRMPVGKPVARIELAVSWAKFEFVKLNVGHAGPPSPECAL